MHLIVLRTWATVQLSSKRILLKLQWQFQKGVLNSNRFLLGVLYEGCWEVLSHFQKATISHAPRPCNEVAIIL
ncbi:unnamed protein product [Prunus armeniaca]|uniref:Uncharacterized protein n=1 Tax=Prunus armeniaca TaxID=36596 RepID=A0A6J5W4J8_PRUAR|nr:unnamed protein product [Prunus armeniaca]